jgi:HSP20 family molecular chaperone IbpA
MPTITIEKYRDSEGLPDRLWRDLNEITEEVRRRAFGLFERRGRMTGSDLENWFEAEREVVWAPPSEVIEHQARIALPGFQPRDLQVVATPEALIVEAEATHTHEGKDGKVYLCEFSDKKLFRRLDLPSPIDIDKTTASLENGMLQVNAPKAQLQKARSAA